MSVQIAKKIVGFKVVKNEDEASTGSSKDVQPQEPLVEIEHMHEKVARPEMLVGATYKVKTPLSEHSLYVTVNDMVLNHGTEHEIRRPFEVFINSKNMDHFQWIVALTRIISAVFRKGGDVTFLVEELKAVFDPRGGYFKKGGKYMPSLVAEIGDVIEQHLKMIGLMEEDELDEHQKQFIAAKKAELEGKSASSDAKESSFPASAELCPKCNTKAMMKMDGCLTCLNCGDSKCG